MALLATQTVDIDGHAPTYGAASGGGDEFVPGEDVFLHVKNGSGASITVTVVTPKQAHEGIETADVAVAVPAAGERFIGPFPANIFGNPADGRADITYSGVTSLTIACFALDQS